MYPLVLGQVVEISIAGEATGSGGDVSKIANIFHYGCAMPTVTPSALSTLMADFVSKVATSYGAMLANAFVCSSATCRYVNDGTMSAYAYGTPTSFSGAAGAGDWIPAHVTAFVEKLSPWRFRGGRPGFHLSPLLESHTTDGRVTSTWTTLAATFITAAKLNITDGTDTYVPVLFSPKFSPPDSANQVVPLGAPVPDFRTRKTLGRQLSREVRGAY